MARGEPRSGDRRKSTATPAHKTESGGKGTSGRDVGASGNRSVPSSGRMVWKPVAIEGDLFADLLGPESALYELAYYELEYAGYQLTLEPRPKHCDRGHWIAKASGGPEIGFPDSQEGWPRYYMDKERAMAELEDWVRWRAKR